MSAYQDYSYLSAFYLTDTEMATANVLTFEDYEPIIESNWITWDNQAYFGTSKKYASLDDDFVFYATEGATYDIYSHSFFDPFILTVYDDNGVIIATDDGRGSYGTDHVEFVADRSGLFYSNASWDQGSYNKYVSISVYEDIDTAVVVESSPSKEVDLSPVPPIVETEEFDLDEIFDWGEETYQTLFPEEQESTSVLGYYARIYSNGNAVGEKDGNIYFYDGGENGTEEVELIGSVDTLWTLANLGETSLIA